MIQRTSHGAREGDRARSHEETQAIAAINDGAEPFASIDGADLESLLDRVGDARVVLIGEATHGTSEFYEMRAAITRALIERRGFSLVGIEGDWPDTRRLDRHVRNRREAPRLREPPFSRFPTWMWRNLEIKRFIDGLRAWNLDRPEAERAALYGLDLYSLYNSIGVVVDYLEQRDPAAAEEARRLYSCFSPWESDPTHYGRRVSTGRMQDCAVECVRVLTDLLNERLSELDADGDALFDAERNAEVVRSAEAYYREMYEGSTSTWNLRDRHMFRTLLAVMDHRGPAAKAVVWAHNSHVGDATATSMSDAGEINIGSLARQAFGERAYLIGFGTHTGEVAAADHWNGETKIKRVRPSLPESHERLFHEAESTRFFLPLREREAVRRSLSRRRLERAIGVIYRPDTERLSHYFRASLAKQFDEYIWFDKTRAVSPLPTERSDDAPEMYPFGL